MELSSDVRPFCDFGVFLVILVIVCVITTALLPAREEGVAQRYRGSSLVALGASTGSWGCDMILCGV